MTVNWDKLRRASLEGARSVMKQANLDALLVTSIDNVRYITGERIYLEIDWYVDSYAAILSLDGEPLSLATTYYGEEIGWKSYPFIPGILIAERWVDIFVKALKKLNVHRGRIGLDYMPFVTYEKLKKKLPNATLVPILDQLLEARAVKNEEEIKLEREAARVIDKGLETGYEVLKPGITENQLFGKMLDAMTAAGSEGPPFFQLCSSGERTLKYLLSTDRKIKKGDLVWFDLGCIFGGYVGDGARTGVVGEASKEVKQLYSTIYEAHFNGIKAIRPGIMASEVDQTIRESLREAGYPDYPHSSGHGVGLKVVELPWITSKKEAGPKDMELKPGMIFCLEPKTYKPGVAAAGLEDMILVTETGHEILTRAHYLENLLR